MKYLILTAGLIGVGKSTVAKAIAGATGGMFVDVDDFKRVIVDKKVVANEIDPPEVRWSYYTNALEHVVSLFEVERCSTVIMDEVFHLRELRHRLEIFCKKKQIKVLWVEVKSSYETVKRRLLQKNREGHLLSTDEALRMYLLFSDVFEPFSDEDGCIHLYNNEDSIVPNLEEVIQKVCA